MNEAKGEKMLKCYYKFDLAQELNSLFYNTVMYINLCPSYCTDFLSALLFFTLISEISDYEKFLYLAVLYEDEIDINRAVTEKTPVVKPQSLHK